MQIHADSARADSRGFGQGAGCQYQDFGCALAKAMSRGDHRAPVTAWNRRPLPPPDAARFKQWLDRSPEAEAEPGDSARPGAASLAALAGDAVSFAERNFERAGANRWLGGVACTAGCPHCCWLPVQTSVAEVLYAWEWALTHLPPDVLLRIRTGADSTQAQSESRTETGPSPRGARTPCPFLVEDRCSVYPARPLACRAWNSTDLAACIAARSEPDGGAGVPVQVRSQLLYTNVAEALARGLTKLGFAPVELAATVRQLSAREDPASVVEELRIQS